MARYDDLDTGAIAYGSFLSCIVLLLIILLVRALCFYLVEGESDRKLADSHYVSADQEISEQKAQISGYAIEEVEVAATGGGEDSDLLVEERIRIPVEQAKDLLLKESAEKPAEPAT
jgi:hypothetical protein